jgi:hypothetical protein
LCSTAVVAQSSFGFGDIPTRLQEQANLTLYEEDIDRIIIVRGQGMTVLEQSMINLAHLRFPALADAEQVADDPDNIEYLLKSNKTIILIGGPSHNTVAALIAPEARPGTNNTYGVLRDYYAQNGKIVVITDARGYHNLDRAATEFSPLLGFLPEQYIPVAATGFSVLLLILLDFVASYLENYMQFLGTKKKKIKEQFLGITVWGFPLRVRELVSIAGAAIIFTLALAWTFSAGTPKFPRVLTLSLLICLAIFVVQESIRMIIAWKKGLNTEFIVYPIGVIVTLISALFGTVFGYPGAWLFEQEEESGKIYYGMMLTVFCLGVVLFFVNFFRPSELLQLAMTVTSTVSLFEFIPLQPINGADVFKWSHKTWAITFTILVPIYILMNFVI